MNDDTRAYTITGSVEANVSGAYEITIGTAPRKYPRGDRFFVSSSSEIYDSVSYRDVSQRDLLDRMILGSTGAAPTWTHAGVTANQGFYAAAFSSSHHERDVMKLVESGSFSEIGVPVPVTGTLFYEKPRNLIHRTYKYRATVADGTAGHANFAFSSTIGALVDPSGTVENPHTYRINVPDSGKLVDVKVWVEVVHVSSSGDHPPLGSMAIAIRAPNSSWPTGHAHPMRNFRLGHGVPAVVHSVAGGYGFYYNDVVEEIYVDPFSRSGPVEFYRNSYLLWEPGAILRVPPDDGLGNFSDFSMFFYSVTSSRVDPAVHNPCWDRDRHMRVIFSDGSRVKNPRDLTSNHFEGSVMNPVAGSPNAHFGINRSLGADRPWIADENIEPAPFGTASSPPPGWLTGPGGTNQSDEWPTTGSSYGTNEIRPVYPLLEDIVEKKLYQVELFAGGVYGNESVRTNWRDWISPVRPGLRGTEISGTWELMIARQTSSVPQPAAYFRQWRLELIFEQTHDSKFTIKTRRKRSGVVPKKKGLQVYQVVSGSGIQEFFDGDFFADHFLNAVCVNYGDEMELNRTIGFTTDSASLERVDFAVYTSSVPVVFESSSADRNTIVELLSPSNPLAGPKNLPSFIRSKDLDLTTEEAARIAFSGST